MQQVSDTRTVQRIFILAGEASGDAYGGALVKALKEQNSAVHIRGWGGESMEAAGAKVTRHYRSLAFMGIGEVLKNLWTIRKRWYEAVNEIATFQPDVFVGIDYPGFNLRMAKHCHALGITTHHYISPSVWAWKKNRVQQIARDVDHLHAILPFEQDWYRHVGVHVNWVGHPLLELIPSPPSSEASVQEHAAPTLLLLPGSRKQELDRMIPAMLAAATLLPEFQPVIAGAPGRDASDYVAATRAGVPVVFGQTRELMHQADVALVTSGTATLEAALLGLPHVIAYQTSWLTYAVAKMLVKTRFIGLPNILLQKPSVPELIQRECTPENLAQHVRSLHDGHSLTDKGKGQQVDQLELRDVLRGPGVPSQLVARSILGT